MARVARCARMNEPTRAPPVLVTCLRCGRETDTWVSVLWQRERDREGDVEITASTALATLCEPCAALVHEAVLVAVDVATQ